MSSTFFSLDIRLVETTRVRDALVWAQRGLEHMIDYRWHIAFLFPPFALPFVCAALARLRGRGLAAGVVYSLGAFVPSLLLLVRDPEPLTLLEPIGIMAFASTLGVALIALAGHLGQRIDGEIVLRLRGRAT